MVLRPSVTLPSLFPQIERDARWHAEGVWPEECIGVVTSSLTYQPLENYHETPETAFRIGEGDYKWMTSARAVIHNHPSAPPQPSRADMVTQAAWGIPFGVFQTERDEGGFTHSSTVWWPQPLTTPLIGRPFIHGVWDCYSLIRDWYYQERGETLGDYPRDDEWWSAGEDMYEDNFRSEGFTPVEGQPQEGDIILFRVYWGGSNKERPYNHAGIYLDGDRILHHLYGRLSGIETASPRIRRWEGKIIRRC